MKENKENWMDVQDQKILLHECKMFMMDYIMQELDSNYMEKGQLIEKSRELLTKLKNY
jgi:hypothetical protein